jgi:hypothetical protein
MKRSGKACGRAPAGYGEGMEGYPTPEEAARGDIPERFARIVSVDVSQSRDRACVVLEVHPGPPRILEDCQCFLEDGRWSCDSLGTRHG